MHRLKLLKDKTRFIRYLFIAWLRHACNKPLVQRIHLSSLLTVLGLTGEGVEVGAMRGDYSEMILKYSRLTTLCIVDAWKEFPKSIYFDIANVHQAEQEERYVFIQKRLNKYGKRVKILRMLSCEAVQQFQSEKLDFVYIDANHYYSECKNDLELWWPKLRKGGVFAGHDYMDDPIRRCGVKKAVDEFVDTYKQKLFVINGEFPTWYLIKNT